MNLPGVKGMKKTILIVDDVYPNRFLIEELFSDYKIYGAADGNTMRELLKTVTPDLILMDVNLPEQDGYELAKELKNNKRTENIPVIFLTVHNTKTDVIHGIKAGGADYIVKPFNEDDLKERVEKVMKESILKKTGI